jgi:hypothetical protein
MKTKREMTVPLQRAGRSGEVPGIVDAHSEKEAIRLFGIAARKLQKVIQEQAGVNVEKTEHHRLSDTYELFVIQLAPTADPSQDKKTASSFVIERDGQYINATFYNTASGSAGKTDPPQIDWKGVLNGLIQNVL